MIDATIAQDELTAEQRHVLFEAGWEAARQGLSPVAGMVEYVNRHPRCRWGALLFGHRLYHASLNASRGAGGALLPFPRTAPVSVPARRWNATPFPGYGNDDAGWSIGDRADQAPRASGMTRAFAEQLCAILNERDAALATPPAQGDAEPVTGGEHG